MGNGDESSNSTKQEHTEILKEQNMATSTQQEDITIQVEQVGNGVAACLANFFKEDSESITLFPRVPEIHRQGANGAYDPQIISIGPYHWGKRQFEDMEKQKRRFLQKLLDRNPDHRLEDYIKEVESLEEQLRRCYHNKDICMIGSQNFVEMMLVDGCFLIEFFLQVQQGILGIRGFGSQTYMFRQLVTDIMKLENQLPFFLLQCIYNIFATPENTVSPSSFIKVALTFSCVCIRCDPQVLTDNELQDYHTETIHHFLHLHHLFLVSQFSRPKPMFQTTSKSSSSILGRMCMILFHLVTFNAFKSSKDLRNLYTIPSATQLHELGVKFKVFESENWQIKFSHGVMEISPLFLNNADVIRLQNIIAFEVFNVKDTPHFCSFFKFIELLVNTSNDVALLRRYGIIEHEIGSDKELVLLISQLTKGILCTRSEAADHLCDKVNEYCSIKWHRWWASLIRDYWSSPWKTIASVAAVILLVLTFIQSYMSLYSYFRPPRP